MIRAAIIAAVALAVTAIAGAVFWWSRRAEREKRRAFLAKYGVEPKEATEKLILPITDQLFEEGADWPQVEQAARGIMADLWMLQGEQAKALSIIHGAWLRSRAFVEKYGSSKAEVRKDLPAFIKHMAEKGPET